MVLRLLAVGTNPEYPMNERIVLGVGWGRLQGVPRLHGSIEGQDGLSQLWASEYQMPIMVSV